MSQTRRSFAAGVAFALLGSISIAASPAVAQQLKEVRIGFQRAGIFPAVKQRHTVEDALKSRGIEVKWVEFSFGPPLLEALNTGNIDFGYTGDAPPIFAQAARANLLYVAALPSAGNMEEIKPFPDRRRQAPTKGQVEHPLAFGSDRRFHEEQGHTIVAFEQRGAPHNGRQGDLDWLLALDTGAADLVVHLGQVRAQRDLRFGRQHERARAGLFGAEGCHI